MLERRGEGADIDEGKAEMLAAGAKSKLDCSTEERRNATGWQICSLADEAIEAVQCQIDRSTGSLLLLI